MAIVKTLTIWGSTFELKQPLETTKGACDSGAQYKTKCMGIAVEGITLSSLKRDCAKIIHEEYYKLFVLNKDNTSDAIEKRRVDFNENVKSKINIISNNRKVYETTINS